MERADGAVEVEAGWVDARGRRVSVRAPGLGETLPGHLLPARGDGALHGHAAAPSAAQALEVDGLKKPGVLQQGVEQSVHSGEERERILAHLCDERRQVAEVEGIQRCASRAHDSLMFRVNAKM